MIDSHRPLFFVLLLAACGGDEATTDLPSIEDLPWPGEPSPLPACTPFAGGFSEPSLDPPAGDVRIEASAAMQPLGYTETVEITVLSSLLPDASAAGTLAISLDPGGEVVSASTVEAGRATVVLRFDQPGVHAITALFEPDGRTGTVELFVYDTQLPVWQVTVDEAELDAILAQPGDDIEADASVDIDGETHAVAMRLHGGSSRYYSKKSFRFDLDKGLTAAGERHLILRSEFADKTQLRNWLSMELFRTGTWLPTPRSELVHLRVNGRYYGVMDHVERIDSDFLLGSGLSPSASLYEADPPLALAVPGGNLTPLPADDYQQVYQWHNGGEAYVDLIDLIEVVLQRSDSLLAESADSEIAIDNYLVYLAMMATIQNHDHVRKNFYIYQDIYAAEHRWFMLPWDLDLSLGHLWTEENDILDERVFIDADLFVGVEAPERFGYYNQMADRILTIGAYRERFLLMLEYIATNRFTEDFVVSRIENAVCRATPDLLADVAKRSVNLEYVSRVDEIGQFTRARQAFILGEVARQLP